MTIRYLAGLSSNLISTGTLSSTDEDSNFPVDNLGTGNSWNIFRFDTAATDGTITVDLGSATPVTFCSVHGHNIDSGITAIQFRRSNDNFSANDTLVATMTKASPAFYATFSSQNFRYFRLKFVGTNATPIWIGEWVIGAYSTLSRNQNFGWEVETVMPQQRVVSSSGQILAVNLANSHTRNLDLKFVGLTESEKDEVEDMHIDSKWGEEPLVIVPDTSSDIVVHGRVKNAWKYKLDPKAESGALYKYMLEIVEDPLPIFTT